MDYKFKVKINDSFEYLIISEELQKLDFQETSKGKFHLLKDNRSFSAELIKSDFINRSYTIKINSNTYNVEIDTSLDILIEEMGLSLGAAQVVNDIIAPMPGLILDVYVKEGEEVKEGDYLLVLEAMKMENTLTAPRDGVVKSVSVVKGKTVDKNQLLIEME